MLNYSEKKLIFRNFELGKNELKVYLTKILQEQKTLKLFHKNNFQKTIGSSSFKPTLNTKNINNVLQSIEPVERDFFSTLFQKFNSRRQIKIKKKKPCEIKFVKSEGNLFQNKNSIQEKKNGNIQTSFSPVYTLYNVKTLNPKLYKIIARINSKNNTKCNRMISNYSHDNLFHNKHRSKNNLYTFPKINQVIYHNKKKIDFIEEARTKLRVNYHQINLIIKSNKSTQENLFNYTKSIN